MESVFNAVLVANDTKNCEKVTYAKVTAASCVNNRTKEQTTKRLFESLGLEIPKEIEDSYVIQTPGRHGNCLLYSVARLIYKSPTHQSVDFL